MRAIFSLLFGAEAVLLTSRGGRADTADIYYRRDLWLMLFGASVPPPEVDHLCSNRLDQITN